MYEKILYPSSFNMKRFPTLLASKWEKSYSLVHRCLKTRMQVCILCSISLCIKNKIKRSWNWAWCSDNTVLLLSNPFLIFILFCLFWVFCFQYLIIQVNIRDEKHHSMATNSNLLRKWEQCTVRAELIRSYMLNLHLLFLPYQFSELISYETIEGRRGMKE